MPNKLLNNNIELCVQVIYSYQLHYNICDVPHRHPIYVGALDFELRPCFVKIIFFGQLSFLTLIENTLSKQYKYKILKIP